MKSQFRFAVYLSAEKRKKRGINKRTMDRPQKKQQESGMEFRFKSIRKDGRQTRGVPAQSAGRYQGCILSVWNIL